MLCKLRSEGGRDKAIGGEASVHINMPTIQYNLDFPLKFLASTETWPTLIGLSSLAM